jgi:hypothetical protein
LFKYECREEGLFVPWTLRKFHRNSAVTIVDQDYVLPSNFASREPAP